MDEKPRRPRRAAACEELSRPPDRNFHDAKSPRKLPGWKPLFACHGRAGGDAGAFLRACCPTPQFVVFCIPHATRIAAVCPTPHAAQLKSARFHSVGVQCQKFWQVFYFVSHWDLRIIVIPRRPKQRPSNNNCRYLQFIALLGGVGLLDDFEEGYSCVAARVLWLLFGRVFRRDDCCLESIGQRTGGWPARSSRAWCTVTGCTPFQSRYSSR
jgi:hypothetical protein